MPDQKATAIAHPNIAFIKYWGNRDDELRLPANPSLSMNLGDLHTTTTVAFDESLEGDEVTIDELVAEFEIELLDDYMARSIAHRDDPQNMEPA